MIGTLPLQSAIMFAVSAVFSIVGLWLLWQLRRPLTQPRIYAYRMTGVMTLSGGVVLAMSAAAMWQWSLAG